MVPFLLSLSGKSTGTCRSRCGLWRVAEGSTGEWGDGRPSPGESYAELADWVQLAVTRPTSVWSECGMFQEAGRRGNEEPLWLQVTGPFRRVPMPLGCTSSPSPPSPDPAPLKEGDVFINHLADDHHSRKGSEEPPRCSFLSVFTYRLCPAVTCVHARLTAIVSPLVFACFLVLGLLCRIYLFRIIFLDLPCTPSCI